MTYPDDYINKIICGDCLEVMKGMPDKSVDLVLTDPPYGIDGEEKIDIVIPRLVLAQKKSINMAIILDWRNSHKICSILKNKIGELVWEYGWISGGRTKAKYGILPTHNTIHCFGNIENFKFIKGSIIKRQAGFSSPRQCSYAKKSGHPYEKPKELIKYLLKNIKSDIIFDPFLGSGTIALAAKELGRKFIGIEISEPYCRIAKKRLAQDYLF